MKTTIDWLTFRCQNSPFTIVDALKPLFGSAADLVTFDTGHKGKDGWLFAGRILLAGDINLGRIDYGGDSQRGWVRVNLTGDGCDWVQDWSGVVNLQHVLTSPTIKRLDIALTTYKGEIDDEFIRLAHLAGDFTCGGRPPVMTTIGSSDPRAGRTRYIGSRKSHKFLRCYEKGFEMIKDFPRDIRDHVDFVDGHRVEEIYRVELELKAVDKIIPWESILGRDTIFSSAYPFCQQILPCVDVWRMPSLPDLKPRAALDRGISNCRISYGAILRTALDALNGDRDRLLDLVLSEKPSSMLVEAGVLTLSH